MLKQMSRLWMLLVIGALIVVGCGGQATPQVVRETVVVEKEVQVEVTRVVPQLIQVTSTPDPAGEQAAPEATEAPKEEVKRGGTLTIINRASPKSLVSIIDPGKPGIGILNNTMDGLLNFDESYSTVYPAIAEDFPEQPDDLTYIFHLRKGIKFHDGKEVTSEDVKYTFERLLDESYGATFGAVYREHIDTIETPDDYTVIFRMKKPWPLFLSFVAGNHPKIENKELAESPDYGKTVWAGTGPFMIKEWVQGDHITIVRNPNYWNAGEEGYPYLDEVIFREIPDASANYAALESGEGDVITEPEFKDIDRYANDGNYQVHSMVSSDSTVVVFNTARPPFDDQRVRLAVSKGIDRQEIVDTLFFGYAFAGGDFFPPYHWAHHPDVKMEYDPEGAKALLEEAGYNESNPLKFTLMPRTESLFVDQAIMIQAQLARIGVEVEVTPVEYTTLSGMTAGTPDEWAGDAALYRITPLRGTAFEFSYYQHGADGALNRTYFNQEGGYQNPEFEEKLLAVLEYSDYDEAQREEAYPMWAEVSEMWLEDAPGLLLNWWANADILSPRVKGWIPAVGDIMTLKQVWIDE